jgi:hypothetical protein
MKSIDKIHKIITENQVHKNITEKRVMAHISIGKAMVVKIIKIKFLLIKVATIRVNNFS